jgi:hypothetical protein
MNYIEEQLKKATRLRKSLFNDPGGGIYNNQPCEFVLEDQNLNIWEGIREDAIAYFHQNSICFWESINRPTGHLLSSQISCVNHLFYLRQRQDIATAILRGVDRNVKTALLIEKNETDNGFVVFEENGQRNYLNEKSRIRGAHSTSIDAVMLGEMKNGTRKLFFINWNYTESFNLYSIVSDDKGAFCGQNYIPFLEDPTSPIKPCKYEGLFIEPYFKLMRQTLLAHEMIKANEYGASDYTYLFIAPNENLELLEVNVAVSLIPGSKLSETWSNLLKCPGKYIVQNPQDFMEPATYCNDTITITSYLKQRYWD